MRVARRQRRHTDLRRLDAATPAVEDHGLVIADNVRAALRLLAVRRVELRERFRGSADGWDDHEMVIDRHDDTVAAPVDALRQIHCRERLNAAGGKVDLLQDPKGEVREPLSIRREGRLDAGFSDRPRIQVVE